MARAVKKPKRLGGKMFAKTAQNFTTGQYKPKSKNIQWQKLFQTQDPYAGGTPVLTGPTSITPGISPVGMPHTPVTRPMTGPFTPTPNPAPAPTAPTYLPGVQDAIKQWYGGGGQAPGQSAFSPVMGAIGASAPASSVSAPPAPPAPAAPAPAQNTGPLADAARLFAPSVAGNPFIDQAGQARLAAGYLPDLNMINPAFWSRTDPVIQQALMGLYSSGAIRPEQVEFTQQQWTPGSLR